MSKDADGTSVDKFDKLMKDLVQVPKAEVAAEEKRRKRSKQKKKGASKRPRD
jgi:hypothetical protein